MLLRSIVLALGAALAVSVAGPASAHGDAAHTRGATDREQKPWGIAGDAKAARRTIRVTMSDAMRFEPATIEVRQSETVRFVIANRGALRHEFVLGTRQELDRHARLMVKFPNMEHDEPYMAHVAPGKTGELIWTFNRAGDFEYACLIAGHLQAGMSGRIRVLAKTGRPPGEDR